MSPRDRDQQKRDGEKRDLGQQVEGRRAVRELLVAAGGGSTRSGCPATSRRSRRWPKTATPGCGGFRPISWNGGRAPTRRRAWWRSRRRSSPPTSTSCSPIPRRSSSRSTASPIRRTSARSCARPRPPAPPAWCSRATVRWVSRRRSPRPPPARSSTSRSRSCRASPASSNAPRAHVWCVGLDADGDTTIFDVAGRRPAARARARCRGPRLVAARAVALRGGRVDPHARAHRVAQRERRRRHRVHRDRAPTREIVSADARARRHQPFHLRSRPADGTSWRIAGPSSSAMRW